MLSTRGREEWQSICFIDPTGCASPGERDRVRPDGTRVESVVVAVAFAEVA
jgi:hypothetical protein